jgi:hypothetical protein
MAGAFPVIDPLEQRQIHMGKMSLMRLNNLLVIYCSGVLLVVELQIRQHCNIFRSLDRGQGLLGASIATGVFPLSS